jgi:ATP-binding cassette, subfamily B, bacterial
MTAALTFDSVSFSYSSGKEVLRDVSFLLETGKSYALVGPTGQGKSTTASLMARLYEPTSGMILLAGKPLHDWTEAELSRHVGFILQDPFLFSGTVLDNIIYANPQFDRFSDPAFELRFAEFEKILIAQGLHELIARFPDGLRTEVSNNSENISLGQRQIVNFLRIILRKPQLLILDEATANLDTVTEQLLQKIMDALPADVTTVIIAHRLNTVRNVDQVFLVGGLAVVPGAV